MITTLPSATDVTSCGPAVWLRFGTRKKAVCQAQTQTIAAIIADEAAIGMVNNKTVAVRVIPAPGKSVGDTIKFGGLFGEAPIMPVHPFSSESFISRGGRIPAPLHSLRN